MIRTGENRQDTMDQVSITNLIDVLLVLLLIFMISARTFVHESKSLALPEARHIQKPAGNKIEITVTSQDLQLDGRSVGMGDIEDKVRHMAMSGGQNQVVIRADGGVAYGRLMMVMNAVRRGGVDSVSLAVRSQSTDR